MRPSATATATHKVCTEPTCVLSAWWTPYGKPWPHCEKCKGTGRIEKKKGTGLISRAVSTIG